MKRNFKMNRSVLVFGVTIGLCIGSGALLRAEEAENQVAPVTATAMTRPDVAPPPTDMAPEMAEVVEISYLDADLPNVLRTLATKAGMNLIVGDEVTGKLTITFKGLSYSDALKAIVASKGYVFVEGEKYSKVVSRNALEVEPVKAGVYTLNYAKAEDIRKSLESALSKQGKIQVDTRSNTLIITDTPSSLAELEKIIMALDTQTPQVMIEAKFVETQKNPKKDLGINWAGTLENHKIVAGGSAVVDEKGQVTIPVDSQNRPLSGFQWAKSFGGAAFSPWTAGAALLDVGQASLVFSYLAQDENTELLANPRVVTTDNGRAKIAISQQFPIPSYAYSEAQAQFLISGFEYKDIGIILNVTPRINKNQFITLEVTPEVSDSDKTTPLSGAGASANVPIINTRIATTTVLIKSGNTLAIGGLTGSTTREKMTKVPLLGDVPGLGVLFRSKSLEKRKRELLIFLTPTIIDPDTQETGYEKFVNGWPAGDEYTDDRWMPKDNARPRDLFKDAKKSDAQSAR